MAARTRAVMNSPGGAPRPESDVFADLASLCGSPGYVHALALLCLHSEIVLFDKEMTVEAMSQLYSGNRLIPAEINTLVGLMMQATIDFGTPGPSEIMRYLNQTHALLQELHQAILQPGTARIFEDAQAAPSSNPFTAGSVLREIMFYGGLSAYAFQYRDMALQKYRADADWLLANKGIRLDVAHAVCGTVVDILQQRVAHTFAGLAGAPFGHRSMLPGFTFSPAEVADRAGLPPTDVLAVVEAFTLPAGERNATFTSLHEFNVAYAYPFIRKSDDEYFLLQHYSVAEALYNTPSYWMLDDKTYAPQAQQHRGDFTEAFAFDRLIDVFGQDRVFQNVEIMKSKREVAGEIDVLVIFGDRAIVVQAKSKKLTLAARSGNETELRKDFKAAIEDAVDQARACSTAVAGSNVTFRCRDGRTVPPVSDLRAIFPVCVVADHYPALAFQASRFLDLSGTDPVARVLTIDLFALDTMTEMLGSPLRLLSYLSLRARFGDKLVFGHEHIPLAYHLRQNLWLEDSTDLAVLQDDVAVPVDVAMSVRRDGLPGSPTPDGILTRLTETSVGRMLAELEDQANPASIALGLLLLELSEHAANDLSSAIDATVEKTTRDRKLHDATVVLSEAGTGITVHCSALPKHEATVQLQRHCEKRKGLHRARTWFGVALRSDGSLRLVGLLRDQ